MTGPAARLDARWPAPAAWPLIKICGITRPDLADAAIAAGADMIGLVHFAPSPRHLALDAARAIADHARGRVTLVTLTVDADDATLDALVAAAEPDILQLHGKESPARVAELAARYDRPVAKALGVASAADLAAIDDYPETLLVLDAKPPKGADRPGGHGASFDWSLLDGWPADRPFMLSGGLTPETVAAAVRALAPYAVDVSSGVEVERVKDPAKMLAFAAAVRQAAG
ncbi:phosphoribosylanthranilate isomerase [Acuticoccus yangtzensis]|uniref:phosphoribosylanthranilate isomerase n=1 Tax=Acuticoccus yangtzensis TaxID=1443441 RepID=UPI00094967D6|nr:phosphoribosylanthranilate isomerase [Acuticoccus yangtzensis]